MITNHVTYKPLIKSGIVLGVGLGGFIDGILFHQLLQVHNMLSAKVPKTTIANIEVNMFWDGLFHTLCFVVVAIGLTMLFRAGKREDVQKSCIPARKMTPFSAKRSQFCIESDSGSQNPG